MAKKANVFERAAKAAQSGTSDECAKLMAELATLMRDEQVELEDLRPPGQQVYDGAGLAGVLPAGRRYEQAAAANDRDTVAACETDFGRLSSRLDTAARLSRSLQERAKTAAAEEALAAAPKQARDAIRKIAELCDRNQAAREQLAAVHAELAAAFQSLMEARTLDPSAPAPTLEQFYRVGVELAFMLPQRRQAREGGICEPVRITTPLFGNPTNALRAARALVDVPRSVRERMRAVMSDRSSAGRGLDSHWTPDVSDAAVSSRLVDWYRELVKLLGRGDVEQATKLPAPRMRQGRPVFDDAAA